LMESAYFEIAMSQAGRIYARRERGRSYTLTATSPIWLRRASLAQWSTVGGEGSARRADDDRAAWPAALNSFA
jgi:hypothetical protein